MSRFRTMNQSHKYSILADDLDCYGILIIRNNGGLAHQWCNSLSQEECAKFSRANIITGQYLLNYDICMDMLPVVSYWKICQLVRCKHACGNVENMEG